MKGLQGIVIAAALGIVGAVCNWFYIAKQADNYARVGFVAVAPGTQIKLGDRFTREDFVKIDIPQNQLGNLDITAVKWRDLDAVTGLAAIRSYNGSEILLQQDLKTPAKEDLNKMIGKNERVMWLPVDSRTFNPAHVNPGDLVSFKVSRFTGRSPTSASNTQPANSANDEIIGPFRILALGNRKGRREIQRAAGQPTGSENVVAISVEVRNSQLEPKAKRISEILQLTNFQGIQVLLHPASDEKGAAK